MPELIVFMLCVVCAIALIGIGIVIGKSKWVENEDEVQEFIIKRKEKNDELLH